MLIRGWALINFSAFWMGTYSRWALIRGQALIRINTVTMNVLRLTALSSFTINSLSPKSDQHQFSRNNIDTYSRGKIRRIYEMIT